MVDKVLVYSGTQKPVSVPSGSFKVVPLSAML